MGAMQYLRDPKKLKIGMFFIMILVIPSFVLFYGFGSDQSGGPGIIDRPIVTVKTSGGQRQVMGSQTRTFRETIARRLAGVYQSQNQQPVDQRLFAQINSGISNREIAEYAAGLLAIEDLADRYEVVITPTQVSDELRAQGITSEMMTQILRQQRRREVDFLADQAKSMRSQRAAEILTTSARVSLPELWQEYSMANSQVAVEFVNLQVFTMQETIEVSGEEAQAYFDEFSSRYVQPQQRVYRYVALTPPNVDVTVDPTEEELAALYEAIDPDEDLRFALPSGIEVRQIVISTEERSEEEAKTIAADLLTRLEAGEDFAALANEFSDDVHNIQFIDDSRNTEGPPPPPTWRDGLLPERLSATNESDWRNEFGVEWVTAIQDMEVGAEPATVPVDGGIAIVKVESIEEGGKRPLSEVSEMLRGEIRSERTVARRDMQMALVNELEPRFREAVAANTNLDGVAAAMESEVRVTAPVNLETFSLPGVGSLFQHRELIMGLELNEVSPVMRTSGSPPTLVSIQVSEVIAERPQTFEEAKAAVTRELKAVRAQEKVAEIAQQLQAAVEAGSSLQEAAEALELGANYQSVEESFLLSQPPPGLVSMPDAQRDFASRAIKASVGDTFVVENTIPGSDRVFSTAVVRLTERIQPDRGEFLAEVNNIEFGLMMVKMETVLNAYKKQALQRLDVQYDEDFVREADPRAERRRRS